MSIQKPCQKLIKKNRSKLSLIGYSPIHHRHRKYIIYKYTDFLNGLNNNLDIIHILTNFQFFVKIRISTCTSAINLYYSTEYTHIKVDSNAITPKIYRKDIFLEQRSEAKILAFSKIESSLMNTKKHSHHAAVRYFKKKEAETVYPKTANQIASPFYNMPVHVLPSSWSGLLMNQSTSKAIRCSYIW